MLRSNSKSPGNPGIHVVTVTTCRIRYSPGGGNAAVFRRLSSPDPTRSLRLSVTSRGRRGRRRRSADVLHLFPPLARSTATTHLPRHKFIGIAAASHAQTTRHSRRLVIHTGWVKKVSCRRNVEISVAWGSYGSIYVIGNVTIRSSAYDFLFEFNRNHASILYCFRDTAGYLSKVADFYPPHLHLAPPYGLILVEFRGDFWHQKTRVSGLSCYCVRDVDGSCAKHLTIEFLRSLCC